jgi:hypothetical protein
MIITSHVKMGYSENFGYSLLVKVERLTNLKSIFDKNNYSSDYLILISMLSFLIYDIM